MHHLRYHSAKLITLNWSHKSLNYETQWFTSIESCCCGVKRIILSQIRHAGCTDEDLAGSGICFPKCQTCTCLLLRRALQEMLVGRIEGDCHAMSAASINSAAKASDHFCKKYLNAGYDRGFWGGRLSVGASGTNQRHAFLRQRRRKNYLKAPPLFAFLVSRPAVRWKRILGRRMDERGLVGASWGTLAT